jgi:hypothetical protein
MVVNVEWNVVDWVGEVIMRTTRDATPESTEVLA